ncbi:type VI secretion system contractile sheath small subunit [Cupriavidus gilardii]|uniref:Type VI secretion system contractile sheath small subunit n=1 Tax=Cupriavidus gilardii TaxID=82541 RepID=A0A849B9P3_9BURK|nr:MULTISPECIES: type VI secretion system contractile sheath small subunit [Cupriavidus]ESJ24197.1 type VI secretion protein [Cupriavidus sp. HPC(L)]KAB0597850.1 type VI secretion system contractile sheath small subunit [Cupriavidus gilardii]MCD9121269.1 type VI secretion system contractile sheath small subunit [Cupriavidus sp. UGS-1]MCT9015449.1 type VI secretion system contractile sheath small subunit [Cupriavidus gilardii]MCT9055219.1 type VI secretion system contractile sheath small subuni
MAKKESVQKRLQKVRPPRVQLTYDVEKGDAIEQKELPFVVGVVADLSGQSEVALPKLRDRKFVNIDRDNFDDVMSAVEPRAAFQVPNKLSEDGGKFGVDLKFRSLDDFSPEAVVDQIEPLRKLLEARSKLADLRNKLAGNDKLEDLLSEVLTNTEKLQQLGHGGKEPKGGQDA